MAVPRTNATFGRFLLANLVCTVALFPVAVCGGRTLSLVVAASQLAASIIGAAWLGRWKTLLPAAILGAPALLWTSSGGYLQRSLILFETMETAPVDRVYGLWGHYWTFIGPHPDPTLPPAIFDPAALALELEWVVLVGIAGGLISEAWRATGTEDETA